MKKTVYFILFAVIWVTACKGDDNLAVNMSTPSTVVLSPLPRSVKGYELYSWPGEGLWHFTLMTGTNRVKTLEKITSGEDGVTADGWVRVHVQGVDAVKGLLGRLPPNETIIWIGEPQFQAGVITLPSQEIIDMIKEYCEQLRLELYVSE
jgi:hypothetical protein